MNHKYIVTLTEEERQELRALVQKGQTQGYRIKHAQILLKLDEIPENQGWTYEKIKAAYHATPHTISQIAKRFVTGGWKRRWGGKSRPTDIKRSMGGVEAHIIAIACSQAPEGRERWTLQLIADELVRLGVVSSISNFGGNGSTEKNELKPWQKKEWCIPKPGAEFVARMEDVLDVYQRPYDPLRPVICLDETNRQLIEKRSIPPKPGNPEREDYEYRRCGVADLFVAFEPLACKRVVKLTDTRTAVDLPISCAS